MNDFIGLTKSVSTTIREMTTSDTPSTPAPSPEQEVLQTGISSVKDSFEVKEMNPLFAAAPSQNIAASASKLEGFLQQSKTEITNFLKGDSTQLSTILKETKIGLENQKIDIQMKEAGERANTAMDQATTGMIIGVAQGLASIAGAVTQMKQVASSVKGDLIQQGANATVMESRYQQLISWLDGQEAVTSKSLPKSSDETQLKLNDITSAVIDQSDTEKTKAKERERDAMLLFLDKMREMNPRM